MIQQHDNARSHVAKPVQTYLETLKWEVLIHPPYSPDIAPSDYYLFRSMPHGLADQQFRSYEDIEKWLDSWIASKDKHFYCNGIRALLVRWAKVEANDRQHFQWFICNHCCTIKLHFHKKNSGNVVAHLICYFEFGWKGPFFHFQVRMPWDIEKIWTMDSIVGHQTPSKLPNLVIGYKFLSCVVETSYFSLNTPLTCHYYSTRNVLLCIWGPVQKFCCCVV